MGRKWRPFFWGMMIIISLLLFKTISANWDIAWHIGTIRSELWAARQPKQPHKTAVSNSSNQDQQASLFPNSNRQNHDNNNSPSHNTASNSLAFPLGWYSSVDYPDALNQIAIEGINLVLPYTGNSDANQVRAYLDRAQALGIQVMVEIPRLEVRKDHRWLITQFVKQLKNHPALHSWYLYDEPEYFKISPRLLERVYQAIKTEDPQHQVAIAFGKLNRIEKYLKALDTVIYFNYPCYYDSPRFCNFASSGFGSLTNNVAQFVQSKGSFWMALQGYGEDQDGKPTDFARRLPSLEEERYMIYSSILARANGLLFWTHYRSQQQWIDRVLTPLLKELNSYLPAITNQKRVPQVLADQNQIQGRLFRDPQDHSLLLIALNNSSQTIQTQISLQPQIRVKTARVLSENRMIALKQGKISDRFTPFAVHIYQLGGRS